MAVRRCVPCSVKAVLCPESREGRRGALALTMARYPGRPCTQGWAMKEGLGAALSSQPSKVADMVRQARAQSSLPVSIKIRLMPEERVTVELVQRAERMGARWLTVHGRTPSERSTPVHWDLVRLVRESVNIPVVANGDINTVDDMTRVVEDTGVAGVMCARGLLANPALFLGYEYTPPQVVRDWVDISLGRWPDGSSGVPRGSVAVGLLSGVAPRGTTQA